MEDIKKASNETLEMKNTMPEKKNIVVRISRILELSR